MEQKIDKIVRFLGPFKKLINCHMVGYFTENHWETFVSPEIRMEVEGDLDSAMKALMSRGYDVEGYPNLARFVQESRAHTLSSLKEASMSLHEFKRQVLGQKKEDLGLNVKGFMSPKKSHEVEVASKVVFEMCPSPEDVIVVDAGDGKGYLSSRLALEYGFSVLGIDANQTNTSGAEKRRAQLMKTWDVLVSQAEARREAPSETRPKSPNNKELPQLYQTCTQFIDHTTNFQHLVKEKFPAAQYDSLFLTGLHTCGDLAPNCLNIFCRNPSVTRLLNVGCCYHLLSEPEGFPLSQHLGNLNFQLGRNARMLASQSMSRFLAEQEIPQRSLLMRAMLEVLLSRRVAPERRREIVVGKQKKAEFPEYVRRCFRKHGLELPSDEEVVQVERELDQFWPQLQVFYVLRMFFAPVIESLILLDRLQFLREQGFERSFLVQLFDPVVSPRGFGVVAFK